MNNKSELSMIEAIYRNNEENQLRMNPAEVLMFAY